ncbi:MAG TPA: molybdenum cofactor biosynthesis protein MoaE [Nitrososphaerales archaeon]|nr:molybdenum cofactor biosynthesis protein MoaE [Nitrososphaerales archaeon]
MKSGITRKPIDPTRVLESVMDTSAGGIVLFIGTVRKTNRGRAVIAVDYEAYKQMAERRIGELAQEVRRKWPVKRLTLIHRIGTLKVGEVSVAVAVSAVHRAEAFEAARFAIDRIKKSMPIWKHELQKRGVRVWLEESVIES